MYKTFYTNSAWQLNSSTIRHLCYRNFVIRLCQSRAIAINHRKCWIWDCVGDPILRIRLEFRGEGFGKMGGKRNLLPYVNSVFVENEKGMHMWISTFPFLLPFFQLSLPLLNSQTEPKWISTCIFELLNWWWLDGKKRECGFLCQAICLIAYKFQSKYLFVLGHWKVNWIKGAGRFLCHS